MKNLRKLWVVYRVWLQLELEYRFAALFWVVNGLVGVFFMMFLWTTVARSVNSFPMTESALVTYFLVLIVVDRLTQVWSWERMEEEVRSGDFVNFLLKPLHYLLHDLGENLARKTIRLLALAPVFLILFLIFRGHLSSPQSPALWLVFALSLLTGFFLRYFYQNFMGLTTFWLTSVYALEGIVGSLGGLFSGSVIPLALLPKPLLSLAQFLPFRYFSSFPLEIYLGQLTPFQILQGFLILGFWFSVFAGLFRPFLRRGLRVYESVGQ